MIPPIPAAMRAISGELPLGAGWIHEVKWDGMRLLAGTDGRAVRFHSSNGNDATDRFPELHSIAAIVGGKSAVVDGEVVALDETGKPSFTTLQQRMHVSTPHQARQFATKQPVTLVVFDLLHFDGLDLTTLAWSARRAVLDQLLETGDHILPSQVVDDGRALLDVVMAEGLEGVVSKRVDAPYAAGKRSPNWCKTKIRRRQEFVVGGWTFGEGERQSQIGALLVGYYDDAGSLRFAGRVGSGLTHADQQSLLPRLLDGELPDDPFTPPLTRDLVAAPHFCRPSIVVEVAYGEWTHEGRLRHPSIICERLDSDPTRVRRDR